MKVIIDLCVIPAGDGYMLALVHKNHFDSKSRLDGTQKSPPPAGDPTPPRFIRHTSQNSPQRWPVPVEWTIRPR